MKFARHLLRRTTTSAVVRPIVLPSFVPLRALSTPIPRIPNIIPRLQYLQQQQRNNSTKPGSLTDSTAVPPANPDREETPSYHLTFTCRPCGHRSTHNVSKQGYHYGSVLITCPGCHSRHVISDHLKVFSGTARSFEEILEKSGSGEKIREFTAGQRGYEEHFAAEDILRARGIWSGDGNHVEVLPEDGVDKPTEESWQKGLDAGGRNVYPNPEEELQPEVESTGECDGAKVVDDGVVEGAGRKEDM